MDANVAQDLKSCQSLCYASEAACLHKTLQALGCMYDSLVIAYTLAHDKTARC